MNNLDTQTIFEKSKSGKFAFSLPDSDCPNIAIQDYIDSSLLNDGNLKLPELSEPEIVRHFTNLSSKNHHIDKGFYPLGSCTMKYNPKINDMLAGLEDIKDIHPLQNPLTAQGCLEIMYNLEQILNSITGMHSTTLQPSAGSQGEFSGILVMAKYHKSRGNVKKYIIYLYIRVKRSESPESQPYEPEFFIPRSE